MTDDETRFALPKGTRDVMPERMILKNRLLDKLRATFEKYGFNPLETPALQRTDVLSLKYAGGAEILKETFRLEDQGGRKLGLRYDLTVPLSRLVAESRSLPKPFKRYELGVVWRDGPLKAGRYREFYQCDVDVVGPESMVADAEFIAITEDIFEQLGLDIVIHVNNRKLLSGIMELAGVPSEKTSSTILAVDKLLKIGKEGVEKELAGKGIDKKAVKKLMDLLATKENGAKLLSKLEKEVENPLAQEGIRELKQLFSYIGEFGVKEKNVFFEASLARGLEYYTGTVFEAFLKDKSRISSSLAGGGRFDKMIGAFAGTGDKVPAVGISFGLETIMDALAKDESQKTVVRVLVIPIGALEYALQVASTLRKAGINTDIDLMGRGLSKNLTFASNASIHYAAIVGEREAKEGCVMLKDLKSGKQEKVIASKLIALLKER
ncbi:histidine--tRNA ligase [Candidatus Micrarchaeota archaeon]|nr:histidine--tRNA ligase [Candidatus Micrarchaeota archaeon]